LESKVLLTAVAICIYGILRMTHLIYLSDKYEICSLLLIAFVLAILVRRKERDSSARNAVYFLSFGLYVWNLLSTDKSMAGVFFKILFVVVCGGGLLTSGLSAIKEYLKSKRNKMQDVSADN